MPNFNPNDECIIGTEWFGYRKGITVLDSDLKTVGYRLTATTADDITCFWTFLQETDKSNYSNIIVEIFDITSGEIALSPISEFTYYPGSDRHVAPPQWTPGGFRYGTFYSYDLWDSINSPVLTPDIWPNSGAPVANDEFVFNFYGYGADFAVAFNGVTGTQLGRWITRVRQRFVCAQYLDLGAEGAFTITPYIWANGTKIPGAAQTVSAADGVTELYQDWNYHPITGAPWNPGDIDMFDASYSGPSPGDPWWYGPYGMGWVIQPTNSANNLATILQGQMIVESGSSDARLAYGATILPPETQGWQAATVSSVDDGSATTVTLVPGNEYLFMVRRGGVGGRLTPAYIKAIDNAPIQGSPLWTSSFPILDPNTRRPQSIGEPNNDAYSVILETPLAFPGDLSAASLDSQPYATVSPLPLGVDAFPLMGLFYNLSHVDVDHYIKQEFTPSTTDQYPWLFLLLSTYAGDVVDDLEITIRDSATDTAQGSPLVIPGTALPTGHKWTKVGGRFPDTAPTLTASTQYYLDIRSTAPKNQGWMVQTLDAAPAARYNSFTGPIRQFPTGGVLNATWGEGVNSFFYINSGGAESEQPWTSAVFTLSTIPEPVEGFSAEATEEVCNLSYVILTWEEVDPPDCTSFGSYQIERMYDGEEWMLIADIDDIEVTTLHHTEVRSNVPVNYRIRAVRVDGAPSDWSDVVSATPTQSGFGLIFTSVFAPELTVGYQDIGTREFDFPENYTAFQPQGQDCQIVHRELEDRGVTFSSTLRIRDGRKACLPLCDDEADYGDDVFGPLKAICRAGIPYVCIRNEAGNMWFAHVATPHGAWTQHGPEIFGGWAAYMMDFTATQVQRYPNPADSVAASSFTGFGDDEEDEEEEEED